jgi:hypothetical protein
MLAEVRRARHGYRLTLPVLLWCAAGRTPPESAPFRCCSRSSVYRMVHAYHGQRLDKLRDTAPATAAWVSPSLRRSLGALVRKVPCRSTGGAARGGVARRWPPNSRSTAGSWSRPRRGAAGCTRWAGSGSGPSWWPVTTIPGGSRSALASGPRWKPAANGRWCSLPMNSTFTSCPRSASKGCPRARPSSW